ncbi:uncharacterized protein LOC143448483 [Clavelina lepadiformis]|uniref:uncharacterized protein LOC143448483 n=1 Tax=Clavelina lepadiformis TaxID=159417 RepID=UPI00404167B8
MEGLRLPEPLDIHSASLAEDYRRWKEQVEVYLIASGADAKPNKVQRSTILNCAGSGMISVAKHFIYTTGQDKDDPAELFNKMAAYCNPRQHESLEAYKFWKATWSTGNFDHFLIELRSRAETCDFGDRMLHDKIIFTVPDKLR